MKQRTLNSFFTKAAPAAKGSVPGESAAEKGAENGASPAPALQENKQNTTTLNTDKPISPAVKAPTPKKVAAQPSKGVEAKQAAAGTRKAVGPVASHAAPASAIQQSATRKPAPVLQSVQAKPMEEAAKLSGAGSDEDGDELVAPPRKRLRRAVQRADSDDSSGEKDKDLEDEDVKMSDLEDSDGSRGDSAGDSDGGGAKKKAAAAPKRGKPASKPVGSKAAAAAPLQQPATAAEADASAPSTSGAAAEAAAGGGGGGGKGTTKPVAAGTAAPLAPIFAKKAPAAKKTAGEEAATGGAKKAKATADGADGEDAAGGTAAAGTGAGAAARGKEKKATGAGPSTAAVAAAAMDGVGQGALASAAKALDADIAALIKWEAGKPVPYALLAETFEAIANTTKRLEIVSLLTAAFRAILATTPQDLLPAVYMCVNRVSPAHTGIELGVGEATLIKALAEATGRKDTTIKKEYEASGDLGSIAVSARATQRTMFPTPPLTVPGVFKTFKDIAAASGAQSQERKRGQVVRLLAAAKGNEAGYVMRSLQAKLRIGLAEQSVLVALAHAVLLHNEGVEKASGGKKGKGADTEQLASRLEMAAQAVKQAYCECPSYDVLVPALLAHGITDLHLHVHFMPGVPVRPMLAKPTNGVAEVLEKFGDCEFTCEYKYDGERAQVHVLDGGKQIHIFSRNAEDNTGKYPDIVARLPKLLQPGIESIVLDAEAVGWDVQAKKILPFQVLSTRARKDVAVSDIKVQVCVYAFDCLYLNGKSLLAESLTDRRKALYSALQESEGQMQFATAKTSKDVEELAAFLNEAVEASTEGLIVKTLADTYEPSKRSSHWLKLKKDYLEGCGDTFDTVPIGAWYGRGKRTGVYGAYLLAVWDPDSEAYQTICKVGTGFSEEQLKELADSLSPHIISAPKPYYKWSEGLTPDVWFDAVSVWEVKAADLSVSPVHQAAMGLVDSSKGVSIRFPRLMRVRDDKGPEEATTAEQVAEMYRNQAVHKQQQRGAANGGDDDDDYDM